MDATSKTTPAVSWTLAAPRFVLDTIRSSVASCQRKATERNKRSLVPGHWVVSSCKTQNEAAPEHFGVYVERLASSQACISK